jgi:hypothetical protein
MPVVGVDRWIAESNTEILQRGKDMFKLGEGCWSVSRRDILKQFRCPGVRLGGAVAHHTAYDLAVQEKVIGAGRQLNQVVRHSDLLSEVGWRSIY